MLWIPCLLVIVSYLAETAFGFKGLPLSTKWLKTSHAGSLMSPLRSSLLTIRGGANVHHVHSADEYSNIELSSNGKLIVMDFTASWCMPCRMIAPVFEEYSADNSFKDVIFLKVDVDEVPGLAQKFKVMSMPTFVFVKNGKVVTRFSGASAAKLRETINECL